MEKVCNPKDMPDDKKNIGYNISNKNTNKKDGDYDDQVNYLLDDIIDIFLEADTDNSRKNEKKSLKCLKEETEYRDYYSDKKCSYESTTEPNWYEFQIEKKKDIVISRLSALATLLGYCDLTNKEWLNRIEADHGTPLCKIEAPRHPPLDRPSTNRWKFTCTKVRKSEINSEVWTVNPCFDVYSLRSTDEEIEYPPYLKKVVKTFEVFLQSTLEQTYVEEGEVIEITNAKAEWLWLQIRTNQQNQLMLISCGRNVSPYLERMKKFFKFGPGKECKITSLYCQNIKGTKKGTHPPIFLMGVMVLHDIVGDIKLTYSPRVSCWFNRVEIELLSKVMLDFLSLNSEMTVVEIGCSMGLLSLTLASKCDKVIGLATEFEVREAEETSNLNDVKNATFIACKPHEVLTKTSAILRNCLSVAIVNASSNFGKDHSVMAALRQIPSLWRVIVYGSFEKSFSHSLVELTASADDPKFGQPFLPSRGCIVDKHPRNDNEFDIVMLFERRLNVSQVNTAPLHTTSVESERSMDTLHDKGLTNAISEIQKYPYKTKICSNNIVYKDNKLRKDSTSTCSDKLSEVFGFYDAKDSMLTNEIKVDISDLPAQQVSNCQTEQTNLNCSIEHKIEIPQKHIRSNLADKNLSQYSTPAHKQNFMKSATKVSNVAKCTSQSSFFEERTTLSKTSDNDISTNHNTVDNEFNNTTTSKTKFSDNRLINPSRVNKLKSPINKTGFIKDRYKSEMPINTENIKCGTEYRDNCNASPREDIMSYNELSTIRQGQHFSRANKINTSSGHNKFFLESSKKYMKFDGLEFTVNPHGSFLAALISNTDINETKQITDNKAPKQKESTKHNRWSKEIKTIADQSKSEKCKKFKINDNTSTDSRSEEIIPHILLSEEQDEEWNIPSIHFISDLEKMNR